MALHWRVSTKESSVQCRSQRGANQTRNTKSKSARSRLHYRLAAIFRLAEPTGRRRIRMEALALVPEIDSQPTDLLPEEV